MDPSDSGSYPTIARRRGAAAGNSPGLTPSNDASKLRSIAPKSTTQGTQGTLNRERATR